RHVCSPAAASVIGTQLARHLRPWPLLTNQDVRVSLSRTNGPRFLYRVAVLAGPRSVRPDRGGAQSAAVQTSAIPQDKSNARATAKRACFIGSAPRARVRRGRTGNFTQASRRRSQSALTTVGALHHRIDRVARGAHVTRRSDTAHTGISNGAGYGRNSDHSSGLRRGLLCILSTSFVSLVVSLVISSLIDDGLPRRQRATSFDELITFSRPA